VFNPVDIKKKINKLNRTLKVGTFDLVCFGTSYHGNSQSYNTFVGTLYEGLHAFMVL
jgi:hypothetical protein